MSNENYYWLFSSAAQSIAAFVGLITAGIALAFTMLDRLVDQDDSLLEVVEALRKKQHKKLSSILYITGGAIILNLLSIYTNPIQNELKALVFIAAAVADIAAIALSIVFVISVIHPDRYSRAAKEELNSLQRKENLGSNKPVEKFYIEFIDLEKDIRSFLEDNRRYVASRGIQGMSFSFRRMVETLNSMGVITDELLSRFLKVNKYRNLLFHGHIKEVNNEILIELRNLSDEWVSAKSKYPDIKKPMLA